ncbi:MAG: AlpA family phage regulatory protein [bacterium]|nr:AlpA family phage regulatory protein [bacterium]
MLRVPDVLDRVGVSRADPCRWHADGTFPQALKLGAKSIGWPRWVIDEWLASRPPAGPRSS